MRASESDTWLAKMRYGGQWRFSFFKIKKKANNFSIKNKYDLWITSVLIFGFFLYVDKVCWSFSISFQKYFLWEQRLACWSKIMIRTHSGILYAIHLMCTLAQGWQTNAYFEHWLVKCNHVMDLFYSLTTILFFRTLKILLDL